ncbi:MAG: hypothetical protein JWP35_1366 [Caulobacter sp.]|nr:hypothetical protein [Caulobacter sp.]
MASLRRRFDDTQLGQTLPAIDIPAPAHDAPVSGLIERFVAAWAGHEAVVAGVRITRQIPAPDNAVMQLAGRVYGRHMDGSRCIEVEVTGRDGLGPRLGGMVRVQLA